MLLPAERRSLPDALGLAAVLLAQAERDRTPWLAASVVSGPAIVLGAAQRAGRVVRLEACEAGGVAVLRRATAGTAAHLGGHGIIWTLALPHVAAIVPDATPRTLLNRNVRGFLQALSRLGAVAHYFGREWVSVNKRPAALLGFEATPGGAVVIELVAGHDAPLDLPAELAAEDERAVDRWLGKVPVALGEVIRRDPLEIADGVMRAMARQAGEPLSTPSPPPPAHAPIVRGDDPMPPGMAIGPSRRVPIGWVDTGFDPATRHIWLGGDVLAPAHVLAAVAGGAADVGDVPVEGATLRDLTLAAGEARRALDQMASFAR